MLVYKVFFGRYNDVNMWYSWSLEGMVFGLMYCYKIKDIVIIYM